jgi:hypothetical protein
MAIFASSLVVGTTRERQEKLSCKDHYQFSAMLAVRNAWVWGSNPSCGTSSKINDLRADFAIR